MIEDEAALRALIGEPTDLVRSKIATQLNELTRQFIDRSPFYCLATAGVDGSCDVTPRGDPPGSVRVLDDRTLLLPERPGNRLADALRNILANPRVGLLFIMPGIDDTLRVNGHARLVTDRALLEPCAVEAKVPKLGIYVEIDEVFTHCSKAFIRSRFWDAELFQQRADLPTNGAIMAVLNPGLDPATYDAERAARYARREGFY